MLAAEGILTARGGWSVTPRLWRVVGASRRLSAPRRCGSLARRFSVGEATVAEGDWLSIDGATGEVVLGQVPLTAADPPPSLDAFLGLGRRDPPGPPGGSRERGQR